MSEYWLTANEPVCSYIVVRTSYIWWDGDEVRFVLDQPAYLDLYSASPLNQQSAGRNIGPLRHIILIPSQPIFALTPYIFEHLGLNFQCSVTGLNWQCSFCWLKLSAVFVLKLAVDFLLALFYAVQFLFLNWQCSFCWLKFAVQFLFLNWQCTFCWLNLAVHFLFLNWQCSFCWLKLAVQFLFLNWQCTFCWLNLAVHFLYV